MTAVRLRYARGRAQNQPCSAIFYLRAKSDPENPEFAVVPFVMGKGPQKPDFSVTRFAGQNFCDHTRDFWEATDEARETIPPHWRKPENDMAPQLPPAAVEVLGSKLFW
jgi:hypothetical protein